MSAVRSAEPPPAVFFRTAFPCSLDHVRAAASSVRAFLNGQGCSPDELSACELALVEACNNAVRYAPVAGQDQPVLIEAVCEPSTIELRVTDHTAGFDWPESIELPMPESESGRGLYLISTLMQVVRYFRGPGENILVMRRRREQPAEARPDATIPPADLAGCHRRLAENEEVIGQMVEELSSCYESLSAIFRFGSEQAQAGHLKDFARRLFRDMLQILGADWFLVRIVPEGGARLEVFVASEPALELEPLYVPERATGSTSVEASASVSQQDVWFDPRRPPSPSDPLGRVKPRAGGLAHPLFLGGKLIGTLAVGMNQAPASAANEPARAMFTAGQTNVINTFGDFLAIQVVNARFQEQQVKGRVVARELEIARSIQRSLLPQNLPSVPGFSLAAVCESANNVGGDFYDVLPVNERQVLLVIADVMGKGVPAAMFAAMLRTLLRAAPDWAEDPAGLLGRLNRSLFQDLSAVDMFITAQLALLDTAKRTLVVASAGHCPLLLAVPGQTEARAITPEGMPLGILPDTKFANESLALPPGARVLLFTDGLTEALGEAGERFGQERLAQWFQSPAHAKTPAARLRETLLTELARFRQSQTLSDDQTFLLLARESEPS